LCIPYSAFRINLASHCPPVGQAVRQPGVADFFLRGFQVVFDPPLLDHLPVGVEDGVSSPPITIARLTDAAAVDEIFFAGGKNDLPDRDTADVVVAHESRRPMGVTEKTERGVL